jgi:hypothetical protein
MAGQAAAAAYAEAGKPSGLFANGRSQLVPALCGEMAPLAARNAL